MEKTRNAQRISVGNVDGKSPLGKPIRKNKDNNKIHLKEIRREGVI
jgi:hypothetical protein